MNKEFIYLDYAANTPVDRDVLDTFSDITFEYFANPNSTHELGKITGKKIEESTNNILNILKKEINISDNSEIIYTSGASESNNLAIKGIAKAYKENGKHIISTFLEHSSVSASLTYLKEQGYEIDIVNIKKDGKIDIDNLKNLLREDTILVSICCVDSEVGIVQPIHEISEILKEFPNCFFHVDCTQAIGKIKVDLENVDLISFAPHKFNGLNGFGALVKNKNIVLEPLIDGGASTTIYRSGTPVIGQICALEKALKITYEKLQVRQNYVRSLNNKIRKELMKYTNVMVNTFSDENPYILNLSVNNVKALEFKKKLEEYGVCVSIKSACTVTITPSRIVMAITHDRKRALASWRISLSYLTKEDEIERFLEIFDKCYMYFKGVK